MARQKRRLEHALRDFGKGLISTLLVDQQHLTSTMFRPAAVTSELKVLHSSPKIVVKLYLVSDVLGPTPNVAGNWQFSATSTVLWKPPLTFAAASANPTLRPAAHPTLVLVDLNAELRELLAQPSVYRLHQPVTPPFGVD